MEKKKMSDQVDEYKEWLKECERRLKEGVNLYLLVPDCVRAVNGASIREQMAGDPNWTPEAFCSIVCGYNTLGDDGKRHCGF